MDPAIFFEKSTIFINIFLAQECSIFKNFLNFRGLHGVIIVIAQKVCDLGIYRNPRLDF